MCECCGGDCKLTDKPFYEDLSKRNSNDLLVYRILQRLEDIGRAKQMIKSILDDDIFDTLSKHNPYWDSEHEVESEKLYDCRMKFGLVQDNLWGLYSILDKEEE